MKKRIVCFGDSNTWGYNSMDKTRFSDNIRWTKILEKNLSKTMDVEVIEEGLNGMTSVLNDPLKNGLNAMDYIYPCVLTNSPINLLVIMLGTNDSQQRYSMTSYDIASGIINLANKARQSLNELIERDKIKTDILIIAPPRIPSQYKDVESVNSFGEEADKKTGDLPKILELLSKENSFYFLNADKNVKVGKIDYVHLDEKGHRYMSKIVTEKILEIFKI